MNRDEQKIAFSQRLKQALENRAHPISPTFIATQFNLRYSGTPITVQSANNWLHGKALPNQDKLLLLLSSWLQVSSQWLRFGEGDMHGKYLSSGSTPHHPILDLMNKYQCLAPAEQQIVRQLIEHFSKD